MAVYQNHLLTHWETEWLVFSMAGFRAQAIMLFLGCPFTGEETLPSV